MMLSKKSLLFLTFFSAITFASVSPANAASFASGDTVSITESMSDLYAAGGKITITAPTQNDLTVAGGTVIVSSPVSGGVVAAGGTITIRGNVGNSVRAAGGTITLSSPVRRDVVLLGSSISLDESASVSGDLVANGGMINIQAPIKGDVIVNGGNVTINAPVGGSVKGNVDNLIIGSKALITGNLNYSGENRAIIRDGAVIKGQENFIQRREQNTEKSALVRLLTGWSLYKLITDILASLALIYLLYRFTSRVVKKKQAVSLKQGAFGLAILVLGPIAATLLLILILPGIAAFLGYGLLLLVAAYISKLLLGYLLLTWWKNRNNQEYRLDWKAALIGPVAMFLLTLIPVVGWLAGFIVFLIALGSLGSEIVSWGSSPDRDTRRSSRAVSDPNTERQESLDRSARTAVNTSSRTPKKSSRRSIAKRAT